jgi:hypothetical protein
MPWRYEDAPGEHHANGNQHVDDQHQNRYSRSPGEVSWFHFRTSSVATIQDNTPRYA